MLAPKKIRHRRQQKKVRHIRRNNMDVVATRGNKLDFGDYGLMALESEWIDARQIEAGRVALTRKIKRGGKVWLRIFPNKPLTKKPAEVRMGKGKGAPEKWVAEVEAGRIMFELTGVPREVAKAAVELAASKMPIRCKFVERKATLL